MSEFMGKYRHVKKVLQTPQTVCEESKINRKCFTFHKGKGIYSKMCFH